MAAFPRFLWIICVLLYWRKVNREAEITLQPCLFQLIWTARLHTVTLTPLQLFLPWLCVLAAPQLSSVGSQGATLTPSFSCLTFRREDERRAWTHRDLFKERHCRHACFLTRFGRASSPALCWLLWTCFYGPSAGRGDSIPCSGRQGLTSHQNSTAWTITLICGVLSLITTKFFLRLIINLFIELRTSYCQWLHFCLLHRSKCFGVWLGCCGHGGSL